MNNGNRTWTLWLAGIIATLIITVISFMGRNVIANDKDSRARDTDIERRIGDKVEKGFEKVIIKMDKFSDKQQTMNIAITSIQKDVEYLKKN